MQPMSAFGPKRTSARGRPSGKTIARDFPFIVEIAVPPGGLGKRLKCNARISRSAPHFRWRASGIDAKMMRSPALVFCSRAIAEEFARQLGRVNCVSWALTRLVTRKS
jgi:hypothetical protein